MEYNFKNIKLLDLVKTICAYRGTSMRKLLEQLHKNRNWSNCYPGFYNKLKNSTLKYTEMAEIAEELGYSIFFKDV